MSEVKESNDPGFTLVRRQPVEALNLTVEEYVHRSGAKHFHLANDYSENVFMVAFRTVPHDSKGVAHILEHTALCGSDKFPVRDPFFLMIRRSLNTFMNAFTTSDYTAYPFASQNRKDYFNLMEVYLDAVFFSRLDPLDFAQEGHRIEFEQPDDPDSPLVYKGVVYNEMKGDTSSPMSMLYHGVQELLYPSSTYHFNSGGDPRKIPELSYEELQEFYRTHYHPSNAVFMTFGDIDASIQQERIATLALNHLPDSRVDQIAVEPETRYQQPVTSEFSYPVDDDDTSGKTHIVLGWLLGENTDLRTLLACHLLSDVLLDTSASPLRLALEQTDLATSISPMCGFEEDHMEMNFMCGVEGSDPENADAVEQLILGVLEAVAEQGIELERLEAVLHQLELSQREIGGDGWPYGLQLIFSCMSAAIHRGDPIALLDLDTVLNELRQDIQDPGFIKRLVRELLLDNPHRVRVTMRPDRGLGSALIQQELDELSARKQQLSAAEASNVIDLAQALAKRQAEPDDVTILPEVTRDDIPPSKHFPAPGKRMVNGVELASAAAGTNGITYHQVVSPLPNLEFELLGLLPVYGQVVTEVGSGDWDYLETQHAQHSLTGGISAYSSVRSALDDVGTASGFFTLSSRTLNPKAGQMVELMQQTALAPRFDETQRIRELVQQLSLRRLSGIASNGHQYAMSAAAASLSAASGINDQLSGIPAIIRLKKLAQSLDDASSMDKLQNTLAQLHRAIRSNDPELLVIADTDFVDDIATLIGQQWANHTGKAGSALDAKYIAPEGNTAFIATTQVNHCASAFPTVPEHHEDSAALAVLGGVLRNNFLHAEVREKGGAYGGGAGHDSSNGVFRFYSYRDPRLNETFEAFEQSVEWLLGNDIKDAMLEESVLGIVSSVDAPGSPAGELRQAFHHELFGRSAQHRQQLRARFLEVRTQDLKRVASQYLTTTPIKSLVTSENRLGEIDNGFTMININEE